MLGRDGISTDEASLSSYSCSQVVVSVTSNRAGYSLRCSCEVTCLFTQWLRGIPTYLHKLHAVLSHGKKSLHHQSKLTRNNKIMCCKSIATLRLITCTILCWPGVLLFHLLVVEEKKTATKEGSIVLVNVNFAAVHVCTISIPYRQRECRLYAQPGSLHSV